MGFNNYDDDDILLDPALIAQDAELQAQERSLLYVAHTTDDINEYTRLRNQAEAFNDARGRMREAALYARQIREDDLEEQRIARRREQTIQQLVAYFNREVAQPRIENFRAKRRKLWHEYLAWSNNGSSRPIWEYPNIQEKRAYLRLTDSVLVSVAHGMDHWIEAEPDPEHVKNVCTWKAPVDGGGVEDVNLDELKSLIAGGVIDIHKHEFKARPDVRENAKNYIRRACAENGWSLPFEESSQEVQPPASLSMEGYDEYVEYDEYDSIEEPAAGSSILRKVMLLAVFLILQCCKLCVVFSFSLFFIVFFLTALSY